MDLSVQGAGSIQVSDAVFGAEFKPTLIHQVVTAYMARARSGTRAQKNRSAVSGGCSKPFRQKGMGRARAGTTRSPIWRSGGVTFAARPQNYAQKVNRKMYQGAIRSILSELLRQDRLIVVDKFAVDAPKTRELIKKLGDLDLNDVLVVANDPDENLYLAARNLRNVDIRTVAEMDPASLIGFEKVLVTAEAIKMIEERLS